MDIYFFDEGHLATWTSIFVDEHLFFGDGGEQLSV